MLTALSSGAVADLALLLGSVICYIMAPAPILCACMCVCVFIRVGRERRSPVQEANTVYISIMNQVPELGRERERKKKKSGRKGDPFFSLLFPPSSRKPLRLVFLQLVIWSLCFIFLSLVGTNANFVPLLITSSPMRSVITHWGKILNVSLTWRLVVSAW